MKKCAGDSIFRFVFSNVMNSFILAMLVFLSSVTVLSADNEPSKVPRVFSSSDGYYYAKAIPQGRIFDPTNGITCIYRVGGKKDELQNTYNWYAWGLGIVATTRGVSVVRLGRWASGDEARKEDLAIGFYLGGKTIKEYSTLEIAGRKENVSRSISHYKVFNNVGNHEYQWGSIGLDTNSVPEYIVSATTTDNRRLDFDVFTGEIINKPREAFRLYADTLTKSQQEFAEAYRVAHDNQDLVALARLVHWGKMDNEARLRWLSLSVPYLSKSLCEISFHVSAPWETTAPAMLPTAEWLYINHGHQGWIPGEGVKMNQRDMLVLRVGSNNGSYFFMPNDDQSGVDELRHPANEMTK